MRPTLAFALCALSAAPAAASFAPPSSWPAPLVQAVEDRPGDQLFAHTGTETHREPDGELRFSMRIDATRPAGEKITILELSDEDKREGIEKMLAQREPEVDGDPRCAGARELIPAEVEELSSDAQGVTYGFKPVGESNEDKKLFKHLNGEVTVARETGEIARIRLYAPKPFKPMLLAKLDSFELVLTCLPGPDGRSYAASERTTITGNAMGSRLDQSSLVTRSDLSPITLD